MAMKEELTTAMHEEFIGDEISHFDMQVMGVYGAMNRGLQKKAALSRYGLTEEEYDDNITRVLES